MEENATRITGAFGTERVPVPNLPIGPAGDQPTKAGQSEKPQGTAYVAPVSTGIARAQDAASAVAREAELYRPDPGVLGSIGAAFKSWDTTRLVDRWMRPGFENDTPVNQYEFLQQLPMELTEDQRAWFLKVGTGQKSAEWAIGKLQEQATMGRAIGEHPMAAFAASMLDPMWLVVPPALRLGKSAPAVGRAVSGVAAGAGGGVVTAAGEGPVSTEEIVASVLFNGAAGAVLYRPGKGLTPATPDAPDARLTEVAQATQEGLQVQPASATKPRYKLVSQEVWEDVLVPEVPASKGTRAVEVDEIEEVRFPGSPAVFENRPVRVPELDGAKPSYGYRDKQFTLRFDDPIDKAAYIVAGKGKSAAHDSIMAWAKATSGWTEEQLIGRGNAIRDDLKIRAKGAPAGELHAGPSPFEYKPRLQRVQITPEVPERVEQRTVRKTRQEEFDIPAVPARTERRKVKDAVWERVPDELAPGRKPTTPEDIIPVVDAELEKDAAKRGVGEWMQWNMRKTMSKFGSAGNKIANLLYDNNSDLSRTSVEAHREAVLNDLRALQYDAEDALRKAMADSGAGTWTMIANPKRAYAVQSKLERDVRYELLRREQEQLTGKPVSSVGVTDTVREIADKFDALHKRALQEMKAAGVEGVENISERAGYLTRKWSSLHIDETLRKLEAQGLTPQQAKHKVDSLVSLALRRATGMDKALSDRIGTMTVDRALRKGYFEDSASTTVRQILEDTDLTKYERDQALAALAEYEADAGKAAYLKHRLDLDYRATLRVGGEDIGVMDLIDSRVSTLVDQYAQQVSTNVAFARMGFKRRADIEGLREELLHGIPDPEHRRRAAELFDNTWAHFRGDPAGARVNEHFRMLQAYGRTISLPWSGLWQFTEYANAAAEYGLLKTAKYAVQELPGFRALLRPDAATATSLSRVLSGHSGASLRLRPYITRFEDGYEMAEDSAMLLRLQTANQLVPYANGMRYVHHHQARMVGDLILDRLELAANGNQQAAEELAKFGLKSQVLDKVKQEIGKHGFDVDKWSNSVWAEVRPSFAKMMDAAVLRQRLGDLPAFAAFDAVGKFVFTYRTFALAAHNKVTAGSIQRGGAGALGLLLLYQLPLAMLAVQAQSVVKGEGVLDESTMAKKALGQLGGIGLFSDPMKWITGESSKFGAAGLIPIDRAIGLATNPSLSNLMTVIPVASSMPLFRGVDNLLKE